VGNNVRPTWIVLLALLQIGVVTAFSTARTTTAPAAAAAAAASFQQGQTSCRFQVLVLPKQSSALVRSTSFILSATKEGDTDVNGGVASSTAAASADRQRGLWVLLTVPVAWGTFEPAVRYVYAMDPPINSFVFSLAYYTVATLALAVAVGLASKRPQANEDATAAVEMSSSWPWEGGLELGTYLFVGNALQVLGLKTVPADRAAFLLQLTTIFVPLVDAAFFEKSWTALSIRTWTACFVALAGVAVMSLDNGGGGEPTSAVAFLLSPDKLADLSSFAPGDGLIVAAALAYTFHCLRLEGYAKQTSAVKLAASKAVTETLLSALSLVGLVWWYGQQPAAQLSGSSNDGLGSFLAHSGQDIMSFLGSLDENYLSMPPQVWIPAAAAVVWTGLVTVAYTIYAQSYGQRRVPPVTANLVYTAQPVFTAILAWALLGERLGPAGYLGGGLIGSAVLLVVAPEDNGKNETKTESMNID